MTLNELAERFTALELQAQTDRARLTKSENRLAKSERKLRVTWAVSALVALITLTIGWHKDAIAQGYGMTLAQAATRISALETKTASMTAITDPNTNRATVRFSGVNVQIVDGTGATEGTQSGLGNLIVGYNETRASNGGNGDIRTGDHNLIAGIYNNYSGNGGVVFGYQNSISSVEATITGGVFNTASSNQASVSGGYGNTARVGYASVSGGYGNTAFGQYSSVSGGYGNTASGLYSSVSGGYNNTASGAASSVSGGQYNTARGVQASVSGGFNTLAGGTYSSVSGGNGRTAYGESQWVGGSYTAPN